MDSTKIFSIKENKMELTIVNNNGKLLADSRQVAQMIERQHNELMKSIRQYCEYLGQGNFAQSDFFIESTYLTESNFALSK